MPAPIVLVHGLFGFDRLRLFGFDVADYFRDIPKLLRDNGYTVPAPPSLNPAGTIADRAGQLKAYLEKKAELAGKKVHLIAHSMGGLDSRYMISRLGMADRVISLTTISTPHHGSPVADVVVSASLPGADHLLAQIGIDLRGIADLTTAACEAFNAATPEADSVKYFSFAGWFSPFLQLALLGGTHAIINSRQGANDGMVSVQSAKYGQREDRWAFFGEIKANHFQEINWGENLFPAPSMPDFAIRKMYLDIAKYVTDLE